MQVSTLFASHCVVLALLSDGRAEAHRATKAPNAHVRGTRFSHAVTARLVVRYLHSRYPAADYIRTLGA